MLWHFAVVSSIRVWSIIGLNMRWSFFCKNWYGTDIYIVQIPLSGYGGRSELHVVNMPTFGQHESVYYHKVHADYSAESTVISAVVGNRGNQTAFVNAVTFQGVLFFCWNFVSIYY